MSYDGGHGTPGPLWAEALLAMLYASNGASVGGGDDSGGGSGGGHAIWTVGTADGLIELTGAVVGDFGITDVGAVYLCVALPPTTLQAWARLTDNPQGGGTGGGPMVIPITVLASDWSDGGATITKGAITAESTGILRLPIGAAMAQYNAYAAACIRVADQGAASMSILASGTVPAIDLGLELILFGGASGTPAVIPITVYASDWSSGSASITNGSITAASLGILRLSMDADSDQYDAYAAARIRVAEQGTASMSVLAGGTVPAIDLTLELILFN